MNPLWSAPNKSPAPLMSKSRMAILKPLPKVENCSKAVSLFLLSSESVWSGGLIK